MLLRVVVDLDVLGPDPYDLAVFPRCHRVAESLVKTPGIPCGFFQRLVNRASIFEQLVDRDLSSLMEVLPDVRRQCESVCVSLKADFKYAAFFRSAWVLVRGVHVQAF